MSKQVLFITSHPNLFQLSTIFLNQGSENVVCHIANSVSKSVEALKKQAYDLVFIGHQLNRDLELKELTTVLVSHLKHITDMKVFGTNKALRGQEFAKYYGQLVPMSKMLIDISDVLGIKQSEVEYIQYPVYALESFDEYPFDCYLKITKNGEDNYIHLFRERDPIENDDFTKLEKKNVISLFVSLKQLRKKVEIYNKILKQEQAEKLVKDPEHAQEVAAQYSFEILQESGLNISPEVLTRNQEAYSHTQQIIKNSRGKTKLKDLVFKGDDFYLKHVSMTSLMCCYMLEELKVTDDSFRYKLCSAAYFQNIFLEGEDELKIIKDSQLTNLNEERRERVSQHALLAVQTLSQNPLIDNDVLKLIKEQHGDKRGISFPEIIVSSSKISLIFQIATLFSQYYLIQYEMFDSVNLDDIFQQIASRLASKDKSVLESFKAVALSV